MRLDRLITLWFFLPLRKRLAWTKDFRIPILMYHSVCEESESCHPYFRVNTSPKRFAEQMQLLAENGYTVIPLSDAVCLLDAGSDPGAPSSIPTSKFVVLTFDDGFADFQTDAFPILQRCRFCATVYLPTGFISDDCCSFKGKSCLDWNGVRDLAAAGIQFGSHTVTHPQLRDLRWDQVEREIRESKTTLEDKIGAKVQSFSYPYAFPEEDHGFKTRLRSSLTDCGYTNGVTTIVGTAGRGDDPMFLKRIPINGNDDPALFQAKLEGGYEWMHGIQHGFKILKRGLRPRKNTGKKPEEQCRDSYAC